MSRCRDAETNVEMANVEMQRPMSRRRDQSPDRRQTARTRNGTSGPQFYQCRTLRTYVCKYFGTQCKRLLDHEQTCQAGILHRPSADDWRVPESVHCKLNSKQLCMQRESAAYVSTVRAAAAAQIHRKHGASGKDDSDRRRPSNWASPCESLRRRPRLITRCHSCNIDTLSTRQLESPRQLHTERRP